MTNNSTVTWFFGLPGSGKTTLAHFAATKSGGIAVDSDEDGIRNGWPDTPLATHMLASRAFSKLPGCVFVASLMPLKHPWIRLVGVECSEEVRKERKPSYYAALALGRYHRDEGLSHKAIDMFPGLDMADEIVHT